MSIVYPGNLRLGDALESASPKYYCGVIVRRCAAFPSQVLRQVIDPNLFCEIVHDRLFLSTASNQSSSIRRGHRI